MFKVPSLTAIAAHVRRGGETRPPWFVDRSGNPTGFPNVLASACRDLIEGATIAVVGLWAAPVLVHAAAPHLAGTYVQAANTVLGHTGGVPAATDWAWTVLGTGAGASYAAGIVRAAMIALARPSGRTVGAETRFGALSTDASADVVHAARAQ